MVGSNSVAIQFALRRERETLDGKLPFDANKMLTCMITKGNYLLSICIGEN